MLMKYNIVMFIIAFAVIVTYIGATTGVHVVDSPDVDELSEGSEWTFMYALAAFNSDYPIVKPLALILGLAVIAIIALSVLE